MKIKQLMRLAGAMLIGVMLTTSCSSDKEMSNDELMAYVPSDANVVIKVNLEKVMKNAGGSADAEGVTLPKALKNELGNGSEAKMLKNLMDLKSINYKHVYLVADGDASSEPDGCFIFNVINEGDFEDSLKGAGFDEEDKEEGYKQYSTKIEGNKMYVFIKDHVGYFTDMKASKLIKFAGKAEKKPLTKEGWMKETFSGDDAFALAFNTALIPAKAREDAINELQRKVPALGKVMTPFVNGCYGVKVDLDGPKATLRVKAYDQNGSSIDLSTMASPIDNTAFLKYVSSYDLGVAAYGINPKMNWVKMMLNEFMNKGMSSPYNTDAQNAMVAVVESFANGVKGTVAISAGPRPGNTLMDMERFERDCDFMVYIESSDTGIRDLFQGLSIGASYGNLTMIDSNTYKIWNDGRDLYMIRDGNALVITTRAPGSFKAGNYNAGDFKGKLMFAKGEVSKAQIDQTGVTLPFGAMAQVEVTKDEIIVTGSLTGTNGKLLDELLSLMK